MPDTANAPTETQPQEGQNETTPRVEGVGLPNAKQGVGDPVPPSNRGQDARDTGSPKTQAHPAEFPEAPEGAPAAGPGQLDILLDMDVPVTVVLGATQIPVRRLLQLGPGAVLRLEKPIEAPAELFLKDSKFAEADVVVVDNRFAVRIKQIVGVE